MTPDHAPVHIQQYQTADLLVHPSQAAGQLAQQDEGDPRGLCQEVLKVLTSDHEQAGVFHRDDMRGAGLVVDERHLAEEFARAHHRQNHLTAILADQHDLDLTVRDHVQRIPGIVLEQNDGVPRVGAFSGYGSDPIEIGRSQLAKERDFSEDVGNRHGGHPL